MSSISWDKAPDDAQPFCDFEFHGEDDVFIKQMYCPKRGVEVPQHVHKYDHTSMVARGCVALYKNGVYEGIFKAPTGITIKAGVAHRFVILEDNTIIYCIHNVTKGNAVEVIEKHEIVKE